MTRGSGLAASAAVLGLFGVALGLEALAPERYAAAVQEDEALEWASFWAFALAAVGFAGAARGRRLREGRYAWLILGVSLFCVFVAGEEISWGQRLLGFRPPEYFLASNFQQELNLHNLVETRSRKWTLMAVIAGFGVVLPLAARTPALEGALERLGSPRPSLGLAPAFATILAFYAWYPVRFSGEWVEAALGAGLLLAAADEWSRARAAPWHPGRARPGLRTGTLLTALVVLIVLGSATAKASRALAREDPARRAAALREAAALRHDFAEGVASGRCDVHKRLYGFVEEHGGDGLYAGAFARIAEPERAAYFLDPWNSPWWIRHVCDRDDGGSTLLVYSFGPNRRRDSLDLELRGDDVGARLELPAPAR